MERRLYTSGDYDLLHYGHILFLEKCFMLCNKVVVSLNTDEYIEHKNGKPPVMTYEEREKSLMLCPWVSEVIPNFGGKDEKEGILKLKPSIVAVNKEWLADDYNNIKWLEKHKIVLAYVPSEEKISTKSIIKRVKQQND